ncbi:bifunctional 4-hydroxy-2-oxoglutarate aldolase/2-dehydro-3-deoxy-phosphogluconate aldolase [Cellulomonas dongxiuzhuiae]|uniref:bifunctional 4-hydroxy-2-oxoglutarate aldolase/2-dehydro-3-deoxy-phosphogluconate aldolase n=1 Tax=Cellulomonas dongxiuzhuiae TaxID=2819979 RepID=UPI001AAE26BA|nr:bifunctional 4-hydroxy-2-oxoglutarate aldolase/2-dehydro-3-deoxy-phosphogluconate aldolase [Cellulomonas dongxiuzhuiae]MBO3088259.1 bifunctional 4-hydroxy-2-oxoglutarate aldolase/2-dehydro-3-deoxy-phosphogluconate aldolase [Cellulomonas dongxiuzhuiae]
MAAAHAAWRQGARLVEIPVQGEVGWRAAAAVLEAARAEGRSVGVGTVLEAAQVERAAALGAAFCVSPGLDDDVALACAERGLPHLPGVATPTEISRAVRMGYVWLKAFPAAELGPAWLRAMRGPFPHVRFVCTGGMTPARWPEFRDAGADAAALTRGWEGQVATV